MSIKLKVSNFLIILFVINILRNGLFLPEIYAQEKYLLSENDISGYSLERQSAIHWAVDDEKPVIYGIGQKWIATGTDQELNIQCCQFNSSAEALMGTAYAAIKSNAMPYIWGSFNGSIIGDGSWIAPGGRAIYFVIGNIGINIFKPANFTKNDIHLFKSVSDKLSNKVKANLVQDVILEEETIRKNQIPATEFNKLIKLVMSLKTLNKLTSNDMRDSKWNIDSENIALGLRKEWTNGTDLTIGIDVCQFNSEQDAVKASEIKSQNTYLYDRIVQFDNLSHLASVLNEWSEKWKHRISSTCFSVVGIKGNKVVHVYLYVESGIDVNLFYSIFEQLSKTI